MDTNVDIVRFGKDSFGVVDAISTYDDLPEWIRRTIGLTHKRAGFVGPIEMEYAKRTEYEVLGEKVDGWEVKTICAKAAA